MSVAQIVTFTLGAAAVSLLVLWFVIMPLIGWFFRETQRAAGLDHAECHRDTDRENGSPRA